VLLLTQAFPGAWGNNGHVAVAKIAKTRLTPAAAAAVASLLGSQNMDDLVVDVWADVVRNTTRKDTYNWHFVDIPIGSSGYSADRDCQQTAKGDCSIAALAREEAVLNNTGATEADRVDALKFVIHLVGDIHQPLHCADNNDRGGNELIITPLGGEKNLHGAWDMGIFAASGKGVDDLVADANSWLSGQDESQIAQGTYTDWAGESFKIGRDVAYPQGKDHKIDATELKTSLDYAEHQIAKAGVRLAAVLNRALQ
jgi:hypothetical protein